jgi:hypothetical protein
MTKLTEAQKTAQKKYDERFPTLCVRLDRETYDWIKNYSKDNKIADKVSIKKFVENFKETGQLRKEVEQLKVDLSISKKKEGFRGLWQL